MASSAVWTSSRKTTPGCGSRACRADHGGHGLQQAHLCAGTAERQWIRHVRPQLCQLGQEQGGIRQAPRREGVRPPAALRVPHGLAQQLDNGPVRETGLIVMAAGGQHHGSRGPGLAHQFAGQTGLPDSRFTLDHGQAAIRSGAGVRVRERGQCLGPSDKRQLGWGPGGGLGTRRGGARCNRLLRRGEASVVHLVVQGSRLVQWRDPELLAQGSNAVAVLLERGCAVAAPGIQPDQLAVRGLVQWIDLEPPASVGNGPLVFATRGQQLHQAPQRRAQLARQRVRLAHLPVVEVRAVTQRETLHEAAGEQRHRLAQILGGGTIRCQLPEALDVELEAGSLLQGDAVAGGVDPFLADCRAQGRECAPQGAPSATR